MHRILASAAAMGLAAGPGFCQESKVTYPQTRTVDQVDDYHGTKVADPYRWLEDDVRVTKDVADWVAAQNKVTQRVPRARFRTRQRSRSGSPSCGTIEKLSAPASRTAASTSSRKNDGLQNQSVLYVQDSLDGEPAVLLDPNTLSKDGTVALAGFVPVGRRRSSPPTASPRPARDWQTWNVLDIATGKTLDDELKWIKFCGASLDEGRQGLLLQPLPGAGEGRRVPGAEREPEALLPPLGTPQSRRRARLRTARPPEVDRRRRRHRRRPLPRHHHRRRHHQPQGPHRLQGPGRTRTRRSIDLIDNHDNKCTFIGNDGPVFYFQTDVDAPKGQVIAIDTRKPEKANWKTIVPEAEG